MPPLDFPNAPPWTFGTAASTVLDWCRDLWPMGMWMVTRRFGDDWQVLDLRVTAYDLERGAMLRWSDSICSRMVAGEGPRVVPDLAQVESYREAPIGRLMPIQSYVGIPLHDPSGSVFGTLCAIDPNIQQGHLQGLQPTLELVAGLLSSVLNAEVARDELQRSVDRVESRVKADALTGLWSREGWNEQLARAAQRASGIGDQFVVAIVDLDDLSRVNETVGYSSGDSLLREAGRALRSVVGTTGVAARLGGDEFGLLLPATLDVPPRAFAATVREALFAAGVSASVGVSAYRWPMSAGEAAAAADAHLYAEKLRRQIQREASPVG